MTDALLIPLILLTPLIAGLLALALRRHAWLRELATLSSCLVLFGLVWALATQAGHGPAPSWQLVEFITGAPVYFAVEPLGLFFALLVAALWPLNSLYSIGYLRENQEQHQSRFYCFFALAIFCTLGIALAGNLLTLFIFYEALTLLTYPLVTHRSTPRGRAGGNLYLGYLLGTSFVFLLPAIVICYGLTGHLDFRPGGILATNINPAWVVPLFVLFMFGVGKAALIPVHRWLPAAMVAPTPVSALLHAVAVVKAGVFTLLKLTLYIFGVEFLGSVASMDIPLYIAGFTVLYASCIALSADNLKRRLAYSTISQLAYVIMATVILTPLSLIGAMLHIAAHAFGKITLFFAAGAIYCSSGKTRISELAGIGRRMPLTMTAFAIGSCSMIGVPLSAGFLSKWHIVQGAWQGASWFALVVIIISTLLNAAYFLPVVYTAFFRPGRQDEKIAEAALPMLFALGVTAVLSVLLFFFPWPLAGFAWAALGPEAG